MKKLLSALLITVAGAIGAIAPAHAATTVQIPPPLAPHCATLASTGQTSDVGYFVDDVDHPTTLFLNAEFVVNATTCTGVTYTLTGLAQNPITHQYTNPVVSASIKGDRVSNVIDLLGIHTPYSATNAQPLCFYMTTSTDFIQWDRGPKANDPGGSCIVLDPYSAPGGRHFF